MHTRTLRIANVQSNDVGQYHATVADNCVTLNTAPAILTVDPKLQIFSASINSPQLVWSAENLFLQQADAVTGPWTTIPNAASPYDLTIEGSSKYFRLNPSP